MKLTKKEQTGLYSDYAKIISASHVKNLKACGSNVIEAKREGAYVFDPQGKKYIDCNTSAGIHNLGRRPKELIERLRSVMRKTDQGNFPMISSEKADLGQALAAFVPGDLECSMYSVMRGESFEFACKLARGFTGKQKLLSVEGSWFGETGFALSLSDRADKDRYGPLIPDTTLLPFGDLGAAEKALVNAAAIFLEPIQAENHCQASNVKYLKDLRALCNKTGALLVFDETQTGLGRTGKKFAFEHYDVAPDVLLIGEALGAGVFPIAATIFTQRVNAFMNEHPMIHLSTFGGSDIGCRVAQSALELYQNTVPWDNAASTGSYLLKKLQTLAGNSDGAIDSVSGKGLLLSLDLKTRAKAVKFCKNLSREGVLASTGSVAEGTVVLRPSLTITKKDANDIATAASKALT